MYLKKYSNTIVSLLFFAIPTFFLISGVVFFSFPIPDYVEMILLAPLFLGLIFIGAGFILKHKFRLGKQLKMIGWGLFAFYWSTQPSKLYWYENGDVINALICILGVYVLFYLLYHEWWSLQTKREVNCLNWIAGASFVAGIIYFGVDILLFPVKQWLIETVARQSAGILSLFGKIVRVEGVKIFYGAYGSPVSIIFACTAIQSMLLFIGMISALPQVDAKRKAYGLLATVPSIYFLNLIRNAGVVYLLRDIGLSFNMAHNIIGKLGSLIALIALVFIVFKIIPELYDNILCLIELPQQNGPIEKFMKKYLFLRD